MPIYVWSVKDRFGNPAIREVEANDVEESKRKLLAGDCTDLKLLGDEIHAETRKGLPNKIRILGEAVTVTEADRQQYRDKPPTPFLHAVWKDLINSKELVLLIFVLAAFQCYRGNYSALIWFGIGMLAWVAFLVVNRLPSFFFNRILKADEWSQWESVLRLANILEMICKVHHTKLPPSFVGRIRAKAMAGMGRLPEALAYYSQFENQPGCPTWLYLSFVAVIHNEAGEHDKALEFELKSTQLNPRPSAFVDLAWHYLRYKKNAPKAREALVEAGKSTLTETAKPYSMRCWGILAFLEGDLATARKELEGCLAIMESKPHEPYCFGNICLTKAYLCQVLAKSGEKAAAAKYLEEIEVYFTATKETELLNECRLAIGG